MAQRIGTVILFALAAAAILASHAGCGAPPPSADLILLNGNVYTLDPEQPHAEAVAVIDGEIACVGTPLDCQAYHGSQTESIDLGGKTVVPGLADSHAHLSGIGLREMTLNLDGVESLEELLSQVDSRVRQAEPGEWVTGRGWIEAQWDKPVFPTNKDLDSVSPDNPVWLIRADGHAGVANSAALRLAGITRAVKAPEGGEIMRDSSGEPNGMILDRAQQLMRKHVPRETPEIRRQALKVGAEYAARMGWTQLSIAGSSWQEVETLRELIAAGEIPIRVYAAIGGPGPDADKLLEIGPQLDPALTVRGIKLVMDGALGSQGAALLEPYIDHDTMGLVMHEEADLAPLLDAALRRGVQVETHAIGDRANRLTLDMYEHAFERVPAAEREIAEPRWRIEHAQIVHPTDIPRFAALHVIPSMQASHAITDLHFAMRRMGADRLDGAYAWRSMVDSGSTIAGGSDAPVEKGDPIVEFYAAAVRKDLKGYSDQDWRPHEKLGREEALKTLTEWAAYATFEEDKRGTIEVGKWADFTVLSGDIMRLPEDEIPAVKAEMTIVGGKIAYRK